MTVSYNLDVSSSSSFSFVRLLFRWRGSVWRSVYKELAVWLVFYYIIFFIYRYALNKEQRVTFGQVARGCDKELDYIPLTFLLGFFVTIIIDRWRQIMQNIGWIENNALGVVTLLRGTDEESVNVRRTVIRYLVLSQVLVFRNISMKVRRRFPTHESIIRAGFMSREERDMLRSIDIPYNKYWAPIQWAMVIIYRKTEKDKMVAALLNTLIQEIKLFRTNLAQLVNYDWVPIPLAYPQVVFLAVRVYFLVCTVSRQFLIGGDDDTPSNPAGIDLYVPIMTIIQFIFLMGWMKVAEALLNPLGEDDDDFECNFLIDKNIATGLAMVDAGFDKAPEMTKDRFTDKKFFKPHKSTLLVKGSAAAVRLKDSEENISSVDGDVEEEEQRPRSMTQRIRGMTQIFSTTESREFDKNGDYNTRYFSQMSRY